MGPHAGGSPAENIRLVQYNYAEIMKIPEVGCPAIVHKESVAANFGDGIRGPVADSFSRTAIRLVPSDLRQDRVTPRPAPALSEGVADILDWYIQMAGAVATSWTPSDRLS